MYRRLVLFFPILFLFVGCSSPMLDFSLSCKVAERRTKPLPYSLGVKTFGDLRPQTRASANRKWLGLIPGVLWVDIATDIPEMYTVFTAFTSRPLPRNMAEAFAAGIGDSGLFDRVSFIDGDHRRADFILTGTLRRSRLTERCYYYGSFMYAWLTRILALPYVSFAVEMDYDVRLVRVADGVEVWHRSFFHRLSDRYHTVYELGRGRDGKHLIASIFSRILARDLKEIIPQIRTKLARRRR